MQQEWSKLIVRILQDVWAKYGPFAALLIIVVFGYQYVLWKVWTARLADKDAEIERCVQARNRLEDLVLKNRRSSKRQ